jgi:hypothetical protein
MEDNKFKKDVADPDVNISKLNDVFNVMESGEYVNEVTGEIIDVDVDKAVADVKEMRKELTSIEESLPDVDQIILENIERANRFLDRIETEVMNGNGSATMMESCATLINAVTTAATSITGISYNNDLLEIRRGELAVREKKLTIDAMKGNTPTSVTGDVNITQNTITMTREELLKEMKSK